MQVMSVLGSERAPLHLVYNLWLIVLGAVVLAGALRLRPMLTEVSGGLAWGLTEVLAVYAWAAASCPAASRWGRPRN